MKNIQKGFTLIELMIVVAIIAILAAIAISQYQDYVIRSQVSEGSSLSDGIKTAVAEFYNNNGHFSTTSNTSYGLAAATGISGQYVSSVSATNGSGGGRIDAFFGGAKANSNLTTATNIQFSPVTHAGSIEWHCKSSTLKQKWCASACVCTG